VRRVGPGVRRAALGVLLLAAISLAVLSLADQWDEVREGAADLSAGYLLAAGVAVLASLTCSLLSWRSTLLGLGAAVPLRRAARIYFVGQLGKYVPGSVWPMIAQMELGAGYGLSRAAVGTASLLTMAIAVPVALVLGLLAVPALLSADASGYLWPFLALPVAAVVLAPPVLNPLLDRALRLVRRPPLAQRLGGRAVVRVAVFAAAAHLLLGVQAWLLARDLGAEGAHVLPLAVGAFSLANVAGLLALPAPAGAGVREAVLVLALAPVLPVGQALLVALVSRALVTAGDLVVAGSAVRGFPTARTESSVPSRDDRGQSSAS
jgi:uncharacterized membrane protein YbhN (UPF0104 family)